MKKYLSILVSGCLLVLPTITLAATVESIMAGLQATAWTIAWGLIIIFWIVTGVLFLTALGAPEKLTIAKKALFAAIAGTIVIILAASAVGLVTTMIGGA
ncbi:MAG: hypothetical protein WC845_00485 [Candidatus Staskawiczbacteria bacterium]|jgi:hypothetical protein